VVLRKFNLVKEFKWIKKFDTIKKLNLKLKIRKKIIQNLEKSINSIQYNKIKPKEIVKILKV